MVEALNLALRQEMQNNTRVVVIGEDVGIDGGVFRVTEGLLKTFGKERVIDTPLAEAGIIGTSIGMAINGLLPVAEIQFSGFIYPGFNQLISHASRMRTRSRGHYSCPLVVRAPYSGGVRALEHHSESMEALFAHTPGLKVVIPSNPYDAKGLLISAIRDPDPVIFLEPKKVYRSIKQDVPKKEYTLALEQAHVEKEGSDITLIGWGAMMKPLRDVVTRLGDVNAELINLRTISPLDTKTIIDSVKKTGRCVVVHEAPRSFGVGAEIIARINEGAFKQLAAPVERVTGFSTIFPLYKLEEHYLPNPTRIVKAIARVINYHEVH